MKDFDPGLIRIEVLSTYLPSHSQPEKALYTFAYTITVHNDSEQAVQLLSRHWRITNADDEVQEVRGEGVVGEQPLIEAGGHFRYTSGASLSTPIGCMEGSYTMIVPAPEGVDPQEQGAFEVPVPLFSLHKPNALH